MIGVIPIPAPRSTIQEETPGQTPEELHKESAIPTETPKLAHIPQRCQPKNKGNNRCKGKGKAPQAKIKSENPKPKPKKIIDDPSKPGPSAHYVSSESDADSDGPQEELASSELCCVCGRFQPEELKKVVSLVLVTWAQCDQCGHWTHLRFCCKTRCVRRHDTFLCPHCDSK